MKKLKVVQLLPELNEGGVERGVVEFNKELVKIGFESFVISNGGKLVKDIVSGGGTHIEYDVCSKNIFTSIGRIRGLRKIFKDIKPDIIHARSRVPAWLSYFAKDKTPFVTTVHGFNSVNRYSEIMTKGDRIICVSTPVKEYILKNYRVDEKKIRVIHRGVDVERFNPNSVDRAFIEEFKRRYDLKDKIIISMVGRITPLKDYETFIKAIKVLQSKMKSFVGLIVGGVRDDKKGYYEGLLKLDRELKTGIKFIGSQSKIAEIYAISDALVSSSKKPESFGRSVAEALALNTPVVATNHGGVLDIIKEGENGYFFNIRDYKELAEKIEKASRLEFDGYNYIKDNFSLQKMARETVEVYRELV